MPRLSPTAESGNRFVRLVSLVRWRWLVASALIWTVFAVLTYAAVRAGHLGPDLSLAGWVQSVDWGPLTLTFPFISWLGGPRGVVVSVVVVGLVAIANWRAVPFAAVVAIGASQTYAVMNRALQVPRPAAGQVRVVEHTGGYGWPSGHASFALVQVTLLVLAVAATRLRRPARVVLAVAGGLVVLAFVVQRVYVGAHWPSQTLGGLLVASGWLTLAMSVRPLSDPVLARVRKG
jgi:undecaprenyl-diphosphatase